MEFIPINIAGVFRPLRFINGLKKNGINPIVVTFSVNENLLKVQNRIDNDLMKLVDPEVTIIRIPLDDISSFTSTRIRKVKNVYFNTTDNFLKAWRTNFFKEIPAIIEKYDPKLIITTCPPYSSAILGAEVSRKFDIPLILDMRDAWSKLSMGPVGSYFHYWFKKKAEFSAFKQASAIITVTPQLKEIFMRTHPSLSKDKFHLIYNASNYPIPENKKVEYNAEEKDDVINIGYTGYFYYDPKFRDLVFKPWFKKRGHRMLQYTPIKEDWLYRSPYFFFKTLSKLFEKRSDLKNKIRFHHIGQTPDWIHKMIEQFNLKENVILHGYQSQQNVLQLEKQFDFLLSTSEKVIGNDHYCLPSKLFTYLISNKPVLGFVTNGVQKDFLVNSGMGIVLDPDQTDENVKILEKVLEDGLKMEINTDYLQEFSSEKSTQKLLEIVHKTVSAKVNK